MTLKQWVHDPFILSNFPIFAGSWRLEVLSFGPGLLTIPGKINKKSPDEPRLGLAVCHLHQRHAGAMVASGSLGRVLAAGTSCRAHFSVNCGFK